MNLTERFPLLHLPDRWDWASITMRFQSQVPADRLVSSTHAVAFVGVSDADGPYTNRTCRMVRGRVPGTCSLGLTIEGLERILEQAERVPGGSRNTIRPRSSGS